MQPPVIIVLGPPGHGKTTAREILVKLTGLRGGSCSDVIYHILAARRKVSIESLRQLPKEQIRPALIELGDWLCGQIGTLSEASKNTELSDEIFFRVPSALVRVLFLNDVRVIDGVRRRIELQDALKHLEWLGIRTLVLFVHRPGGPKIADNTEDLTEFADEILPNDGTPAELEEKLKAALKKHFPAVEVEPEIVTRAPTSILGADGKVAS